ncbi:hypothetical protein BGAPBR_E0041 (plasmid) [Borreliella garinii PBr]|uniref:Uncharacterized protein n=1 Tax=Borreliella garinii PBr TaxID=498743 RepID=B8F0M1_BORGR|nr:hypothetical protein BGAPBR_E0041 [Borreliella garinii PBr]
MLRISLILRCILVKEIIKFMLNCFSKFYKIFISKCIVVTPFLQIICYIVS